MKKMLSLFLAAVLTLGCVAGVSFAADPIAVVTVGSEEIEVADIAEIKALISADGTTVVKMLKDCVVESNFLYGVPSFTLDLNGFTAGSSVKTSIRVNTAGTSNAVTTIKNGTLLGGSGGSYTLNMREGSLRVENATVVLGESSGAVIGMFQTEGKWNADNLITGSTIITQGSWAPLIFSKEAAPNPTSMKIENSNLIATKSVGTLVVSHSGVGGNVELGKSVKLYSYRKAGWLSSKSTTTGEKADLVAEASASFSVPALNLNYDGLYCWATAEGSFENEPATPEVKIDDFADVAKDFWGYEAIMNAAKAGLVKGKSENADGTMNYVPNASMTRAEFITVICRYFYPAEAADITAGATWWQGYYDLALEKGILTVSELDYGDLNKAMNREEMALVLSRTAPTQAAYAAVTPAASTAIPDYASVDEYYQTAVLWAYGAGLLKGVDTAGTFNPKGELNRAAVATIFNTLLSSK